MGKNNGNTDNDPLAPNPESSDQAPAPLDPEKLTDADLEALNGDAPYTKRPIRTTRKTGRPLVNSPHLDPTLTAKAAAAVELRLRGHTFQHIADALGWKDHSSPRVVVQRALRNMLQEPCDELRQVEAWRLDRLSSYLWPSEADLEPVTACESIQDEEERINDQDRRESARVKRLNSKIDRLLKIMERRARLMGIDVPVVHRLEANIETPSTNGNINSIILNDTGERARYLDALRVVTTGGGDTGGPGHALHEQPLDPDPPSAPAD